MTSRQWPQPEQDSQAHRTWSNIVENSAHKQDTNSNRPHEDFILLDGDSRNGGKDAKQLKRKLSSNEKAQQNGIVSSSGPWANTESEYTPWKTKDYAQDPTGLNEEIQDFLSYIKPRPEEDAIRRNVVERVEAVIKELWPQAKVELYGSCQTGLYLPTSDIDLVVHGKWQSLPLRTLENALLEKEIADANSIRVLDKATVPIIKVTDKKTEVKVDISFNMNTGVQSADMIKNYMKKYPALPYLTFVLKQFLLNRDLNEVFSGGISSYTVVLMIVSYFQHSGHFSGTSNMHVNLGVLLIEFFELYGKKFNYTDVGIRLVGNGSYFNKEKVLGEMASSTYLCIEDPLTEGNFIGKNSFHINKVENAFAWAFSTLAHGVLNKIPGNESCSILGRVTRISKETIEQRERTLKLSLQTPSILTMPSYASVATRNTRTTTIRSINGEKTIDLMRPVRSSPSSTNHSHFSRTKHNYDERNNHERTSSAGFAKTSRNPATFDRHRQHLKENNETNSRIARDHYFKDSSRKNAVERSSFRDKTTEKQRSLLSPNHTPTSPKRTHSSSSSPSPSSITETCAMRSTKSGPSLKQLRSPTERLFC